MIGMGRSDKPALDYDYFVHLAYLEAFLDAIDVDQFVLAGHDWGSALGMSIAIRHADRVRALVLMETFTVTNALGAEYQPERAPWSEPVTEWCMRFIDPEQGEQLILEQDKFNDPVVQLLTKRQLPPDVIAGYKSAYPDPASRRAELAWPFQVLGPADAIGANLEEFARHKPFLEASPVPKLVFYPSEGMLTAVSARWFDEHVPATETVYVGEGYHYIQEENPELIGTTIARFMNDLSALGVTPARSTDARPRTPATSSAARVRRSSARSFVSSSVHSLIAPIVRENNISAITRASTSLGSCPISCARTNSVENDRWKPKCAPPGSAGRAGRR